MIVIQVFGYVLSIVCFVGFICLVIWLCISGYNYIRK